MKEQNGFIGQDSVTDRIIGYIINKIVDGEYEAGMKLPNEYELINEMGVSRNSLRETMKIMSAMGIVEIRRGIGTFVCDQMNASMFDSAIYGAIYKQSSREELRDFRIIIDTAIARQAMKQITKEDEILLRENIAKTEEALKQENYDEAQNLDYEFHLKLIDICRNPFFIRVAKGIYAIFQRSIADTVEYENRSSGVSEQHTNILQCILNKDEAHIDQVVEDSLETWAIVAKE